MSTMPTTAGEPISPIILARSPLVMSTLVVVTFSSSSSSFTPLRSAYRANVPTLSRQ